MSTSSRRAVLAATGATAATAVAALSSRATGDRPGPPAGGTGDTEQIVAFLANPATGRIVLVRGEERTVVTDRSLAGQLARRAAGPSAAASAGLTDSEGRA